MSVSDIFLNLVVVTLEHCKELEVNYILATRPACPVGIPHPTRLRQVYWNGFKCDALKWRELIRWEASRGEHPAPMTMIGLE